jgi:hypothetical protein
MVILQRYGFPELAKLVDDIKLRFISGRTQSRDRRQKFKQLKPFMIPKGFKNEIVFNRNDKK